MSFRLIVIVSLLALAGILGGVFYLAFSSPYERIVTKQFSLDAACPTERITLKARSDLKPYDLIFGAQPIIAPPAEIKDDPARLAVWQEGQAKNQANQDDWNNQSAVFEMEGCDVRRVYLCRRDVDYNPYCEIARPEFQPSGK
jgi:hypothetical protein